MWRKGVSTTSPEGTRWNAIPTPSGCEVKHINCGPTGLVWAVVWGGKCIVRIGVNGGTPMGNLLIYMINVCIMLLAY
jgi:tectonin beta-propeller repeat-containing protein 1